MPHRMRIEGRDEDRASFRARPLDRAAHHCLVAQMKSVEIAECDDAAAQMGRDRRAPVQALHAEGL